MRWFSSAKAVVASGHAHSIKLKLHDMSQIFHSMDPSPFLEKDLDGDAEKFIVSWAQEFPPNAPVKLHIYLEHWWSWPRAFSSSRRSCTVRPGRGRRACQSA